MDKQLDNHSNQFYGTGWSFPVTFSVGNYQLDMSTDVENVNQSIEILLQTNYGERYMLPQFGSGLQQFFFRQVDETLKGEIIDSVKSCLLHNEPRINVQEVDVQESDSLNGFILISVTYILNKVNTRHNFVFPFHVNEGTNLNAN